MPDTSVECPHCDRLCGNLAGLSAHVRSMHPDKVGNQPADRPPVAPANNGIVWEEPPPGVRHTRLEFIHLIPELRRHPGKWARLYTWNAKATASTRKNVIGKRHPELVDIEFAARSMPDGTSALYGRYTGE